MAGTTARDRFWNRSPLDSQGRLSAEWALGEVTVRSHHSAGPGWGFLELYAPLLAAGRPGHFTMLGINAPGAAGFDPYLNRPFYLARIKRESAQVGLLYRTASRTGGYLTALAAGTALTAVGPLGMSFPDPSAGRGPLLLVGEAHGLAPLAAAADAALAAGREVAVAVRPDRQGPRWEAFAPAGAALSELPPGPAELGQLRARVLSREYEAVWVSGSEPLAAVAADACRSAGLPCFLTLERHIACSVGTCIGCTVPAAGGGMWRVCTDGPVFAAEEVVLNGQG